MAFEAAGGRILGTMSAGDFITVRDSVRVTRNGRVGHPTDSRYDTSQWNLWFTDEFNSLGGIGGAAAVTPPAAGTASFEQERQELIRLVSEERARRGLSALRVDSDLMEFAQIRANEPLSAAHRRPNGGRVHRENVTASTNARGAFDAWMSSAGHIAPIISEPGTWGEDVEPFGVGIGAHGAVMIFDRIDITCAATGVRTRGVPLSDIR